MLKTVNNLRTVLVSFTPSQVDIVSAVRSVVLTSEATQTAAAASLQKKQRYVFLASILLVVVPVLFEAPLVRSQPWLCLTLTVPWSLLAAWLASQPTTEWGGDLLLGFCWTWLAGALYWGWLRWEPLIHLPVESIGLPVVIICLLRGRCRIGSYFYLGSLLGTALTDTYFYFLKLMPFWRTVMVAPAAQVPSVLHQALQQVQTPSGIATAIGMAIGLLVVGVGVIRLRPQALWAWAFGGAVLSTLLVDGLYLATACLV